MSQPLYRDVNSTGTVPSDTTIIIDAANTSATFKFREFWDYRELLFFLVWRQVIVRYKQTVVGILWAIMQPLVSTLVLTVVFNVFLKIESGDTPYPIFVLSGLIFWRYFSSSLALAGESLVSNAHMISKIYFPRVIIPISACLSPMVDFFLAFIVLMVIMPFLGVLPSLRILLIPVLLGLTFLTALSVSLWLSALNVRYRDVGQVIPFLIQIWMYLVPVMYPIEAVSESLRPIYSLNPMVGVIEGARWILLNTDTAPDFRAMAIGLVMVLILLVGGFFFFYRVERSFADVI